MLGCDQKLLGGTNRSVWHHSHSKHPAEVGQCGIKPRNQRKTVLGDGTTAKCNSFDDEVQFEQNALLLKLLQKIGPTLSMGEDENLRHFYTFIEKKTQPAAYESKTKCPPAHFLGDDAQNQTPARPVVLGDAQNKTPIHPAILGGPR